MKTQDIHNNYRQLQESYLTDIDMSGGLFLEYQKLKQNKLSVTLTNFGFIYKATLNNKIISKEKLYSILKIEENHTFTLEHYLIEFNNKQNNYNVEVWERDVN